VYGQPPGRRRLGPAVIALLVLLAVGAGTGSYYLVRRILADGAAVTNTESNKPTAQGTPCPAITAKAVSDAGLNGDLKLLRYVDATLPGGTDAEAWICRNADGVLFYQGHRKSGPFEAATSDDTLLLGAGILGKVTTEGDDGFVAVNPKDPANPDDPERHEYHVSRTAFYFVVLPAGEKTEYVVTRTAG
jgi:hypothetical protein